MDFNMKDKLTLGNYVRGELEKDFQQMYQEIISEIRGKDKGTIAINLTFQRIENTDMMVDTSYTIKKSTPARAKKAMAVITENGILTEKPKEELKVVSLFDQAAGEDQ